MNLENINSPDYETVIGDEYETPVENNPQPENRNTHVTVNLPIDKANEKVCETINIFNYLYSRAIYMYQLRDIMIALHFNYWVFSFRPIQDYSIERGGEGYDTHVHYGKNCRVRYRHFINRSHKMWQIEQLDFLLKRADSVNSANSGDLINH